MSRLDKLPTRTVEYFYRLVFVAWVDLINLLIKLKIIFMERLLLLLGIQIIKPDNTSGSDQVKATDIMKKTVQTHAKLVVALVGLLSAVGSTATLAATDWNYNLSTQCDPGVNNGAYVAQCAVSAPDLTMSGWSTAPNTSAGAEFAAAKIYDWGSTYGLGILAGGETNTTGPHAADNKLGTDAFLLSFTNAVDLESVRIGWNGSDNPGSYDTYESSDISILAYTGNGTPTMGDTALSSLTSSGWQLIGNYGQVGKLTNNTAVINSTATSSWWLISAYNAAYTLNGSPVSSSGKSLTSGNDYFKLLSVAGNNAPPTNETPEPGSLALAGLAMIGLFASRRRKH